MIKYDPLALLVLPAVLLALILVSILFFFLSGWFKLLKEHPLPSNIGNTVKKYKWRSLNISYIAAYRSFIDIIITDKGIVIKPSLKILIFHKPIFIKWDKIKNIDYKRGLFKRIAFRVSKKRISLYGTVANDIFKQYMRVKSRN
jgi:hypothetical protein